MASAEGPLAKHMGLHLFLFEVASPFNFICVLHAVAMGKSRNPVGGERAAVSVEYAIRLLQAGLKLDQGPSQPHRRTVLRSRGALIIGIGFWGALFQDLHMEYRELIFVGSPTSARGHYSLDNSIV